MKIGILGGGITGLTAGYSLAKKGHAITVFEKKTVLGGMSSGFKSPQWEWWLDKTYHHIFSNDSDILGFIRELEFPEVFFKTPVTASLYGSGNNYRIIPVDTPQDFLRFPHLPFVQKIRAGMTLAFLKISPFLPIYEKQSAEDFLKMTMGEQAWKTLWQELFRKKFGKYAGKILSSFIWARIKKRTRRLGYPEGGFQNFVQHLERANTENGVVIQKNRGIVDLHKKQNVFYAVDNQGKISEEFDAIVSTLPTPVFDRISSGIIPATYRKKWKKLRYLHSVSLIIETQKPFLSKEYWMNVCAHDIPIMGLVQHTNFIDKSHYNNSHILYAENYVEDASPLLRMAKEELYAYYLPHLKKIYSDFGNEKTSKLYLFSFPFAQPIYDADFITSRPTFETPVKNLYMANLDMTYPYDRGVNYAVSLGKKIPSFF